MAGEGPRSSTVSFTFNPTSKISAGVLSIGAYYVAPRRSNIILPCSAIGDLPLQVMWYQDGRQFQDWTAISPVKSNTLTEPTTPLITTQPIQHEEVAGIRVLANGSLLIDQLAESGGGNYTCQVRLHSGYHLGQVILEFMRVVYVRVLHCLSCVFAL